MEKTGNKICASKEIENKIFFEVFDFSVRMFTLIAINSMQRMYLVTMVYALKFLNHTSMTECVKDRVESLSISGACVATKGHAQALLQNVQP